MIDISERAQQHFLRLLSQQGIDDLSIRLRVTAPGTPAANCELEFCEPVDLIGGEWTIECAGFNFHIDGDSARWLDNATIDFEPTSRWDLYASVRNTGSPVYKLLNSSGDVQKSAPEGSGAGTTLGEKPGDGLAPRMASVTFGGPDLRTVYIGSLGGTALPTFRSPVPGAPLPHWSA